MQRLENFHRHYNSQFHAPHPNIHHVIEIILQVPAESDLKFFLYKNLSIQDFKKRNEENDQVLNRQLERI